MKFAKTLLCLLICASCTTYVPIEYRAIGEFSAPKNSLIKITDSSNAGLVNSLKKEIVLDGWWRYSVDKKSDYDIEIKETNIVSKEESSSINDSGDKPIRTATFKGEGSATFIIFKKNDKNFSKTFFIESLVHSTSEKEMPKKYGANSFRPIFDFITNSNPAQEAIDSQNMFLSMDITEKLLKAMALEMVKKITPEKKFVKVELDDDEDDMKIVKKHIEAKEFDMAFNYLQQLDGKEIRSDVQYNLGVVQEARQIYSDACLFYQKAYELKEKKLYLEQKNSCEVRKIENAKLIQIKS